MTGEDRLIEQLAADPSPHADLVLMLAAGKRHGIPWAEAWARTMRARQPPRERSDDAEELLDEDRLLLRELRPVIRAAYENRELTAEERAEVEWHARRRAPELERVDDLAA